MTAYSEDWGEFSDSWLHGRRSKYRHIEGSKSLTTHRRLNNGKVRINISALYFSIGRLTAPEPDDIGFSYVLLLPLPRISSLIISGPE
jgi:hypothetical protein